MINHILGAFSIWSLIPASTLFLAIVYYVSIKFRPGLRSIPGPLLASISDLDRIWSCALGSQMFYHVSLHDKYGPLVRVGPKHVMFSDASLIPKIYGISSKFMKSEFYLPFDVKTPEGMLPTVFSVRDGNWHRDIRRPIANAYALSTLKELEPMNDACSDTFLRKMKEKVGEVIDLGDWVHYYAFDVITSITYSQTLGMLESEKDIDRIIESIEGRLKYNAVIGQAPYLHKYLFGNTYISYLANFIPKLAILNTSKYIVAFAAKRLQERQNASSSGVRDEFRGLKDMLARFRRFKEEEQLIDDGLMLSHSVSNIFAGSDTTAAALRSIFYHLGKSPAAYAKLLKEIDEADDAGKLSRPFVTFAEAQEHLPYFRAVIKEAQRMHPAVGLLLERVVPKEGMEIAVDADGRNKVFLPPGTIIGANPWVMSRDENVYGSDADRFRPERWLEADAEKLKEMDRNDLSFGAGARTCLGKNISLLEMSKFVPQVLRNFEFELLMDESEEWELHAYWFVKQTGLRCRVRERRR